MSYRETAFGASGPFEPYDHQSDAEELKLERVEREDAESAAGVVRFFPCPHCDGHGAKVMRNKGGNVALLCSRCDGEGKLGATEDDIECAAQIGSDNPFCPHDWSSGYDESDHEVAIRCGLCGADGDA